MCSCERQVNGRFMSLRFVGVSTLHNLLGYNAKLGIVSRIFLLLSTEGAL